MRIRGIGSVLAALVLLGVLNSGAPSVAKSMPVGDWFHLSFRSSEDTTVSYTLKWTGSYGAGPAVAGNATASSASPLAVGASEIDQDGEVAVAVSLGGSPQEFVIKPYPQSQELFATSFGAVRVAKGGTTHLVWFVTNATMRLEKVEIAAERGQLTHEISGGSGSAAVELAAGSAVGTWGRIAPVAAGDAAWQLDMPAGVGAFLPCSFCTAEATAPGGQQFPSTSVDGRTQGFQGFAGAAGRWLLEWSGVRANPRGRPAVAVHVPIPRWTELQRQGVSRG